MFISESFTLLLLIINFVGYIEVMIRKMVINKMFIDKVSLPFASVALVFWNWH